MAFGLCMYLNAYYSFVPMEYLCQPLRLLRNYRSVLWGSILTLLLGCWSFDILRPFNHEIASLLPFKGTFMDVSYLAKDAFLSHVYAVYLSFVFGQRSTSALSQLHNPPLSKVGVDNCQANHFL